MKDAVLAKDRWEALETTTDATKSSLETLDAKSALNTSHDHLLEVEAGVDPDKNTKLPAL
jgi:hypothetical protein